MINPARLHSDLSRLGRETDMLLATVESLADDEMTVPSLCEGWTRADVIAHLASSGRALVKLIDWATSGEERPLYASSEARSRRSLPWPPCRGRSSLGSCGSPPGTSPSRHSG